jgi:hypothetical chaperone protein
MDAVARYIRAFPRRVTSGFEPNGDVMRLRSCGLDFGTSNSTLGVVDPDGTPHLVALEDASMTIPSVLFFNFEDDQVYFGRKAIGEYVSGADGRMMRALKSILGSSLMNDETRIKARRVPFTEILGIFLAELRRRAEAVAGDPLDEVVAGRPVHFVDDNDAADAEAQNQLEAAIRAHGFRHVEFQFEPIAAALDYERRIGDEQLALVVDIGGGTSDFTIVRLSPERARAADRQSDILATAGVHVGGTDFDRLLSMAEVMPLLGLGTQTVTANRSLPIGPYYDLATWHRINRLYNRQTMAELRSTRQEAEHADRVEKLIAIVRGRYGHLLASRVEEVKIALTENAIAALDFAAADVALRKPVSRSGFDHAIRNDAHRIPQTISETLKLAGIGTDDIQTLIMTGGSTQIPLIRQSLDRTFENARFVETDAFGSVGLGLALDASRRF